MKINKYATTLTAQVDKDKLMNNSEFTRQALATAGASIRELNEAEQSFSATKIRLPKEVIQAIAKPVKDGIKSDVGRTGRTTGSTLSIYHAQVVESFEYLVDYMDKHFNTHIVPTESTVKVINVLAAVDLVSLYTDYVANLAVAVMYGYADSAAKRRSYQPPQRIVVELKAKRAAFIHAMVVLARGVKPLRDSIEGLPDIIVDNQNEDMMSSAHASAVMNSPLSNVSGFNGNPILYVANFIMDLEVMHIKSLREKKTQLEVLRVLVETEVQEDGSPAAQRELESIEERINSIDSKLDYWEAD